MPCRWYGDVGVIGRISVLDDTTVMTGVGGGGKSRRGGGGGELPEGVTLKIGADEEFASPRQTERLPFPPEQGEG